MEQERQQGQQRLADLHCHYPMHLLSESEYVRLRNVPRWRSAREAALMWVANRWQNYAPGSRPRGTVPELRGDGWALLSVLYWPFSEIDIGRRYGSRPLPGYPKDLFEHMKTVEKRLAKERDEQSGEVDHTFVRNAHELDDALADPERIAFVHCVEGGFHLGSTPEEVTETVAELAKRGVAYITLAHLFWRQVATNAPAIPILSDSLYNALFPQETDEPLSDLGAAAIRAMYEHHVLMTSPTCALTRSTRPSSSSSCSTLRRLAPHRAPDHRDARWHALQAVGPDVQP